MQSGKDNMKVTDSLAVKMAVFCFVVRDLALFTGLLVEMKCVF